MGNNLKTVTVKDNTCLLYTSTENAEERTVKGKKANVIVYTCPVLQLNRNIEDVYKRQMLNHSNTQGGRIKNYRLFFI